jgi:hypothetical protein
MIHFFPELAALYHRSLLVSLDEGGKAKIWDEWIKELWKFSPDKNSFYSITPATSGETLSAYLTTSLGKRNKDDQKLLGFCTSLEQIVQKPQCVDCADSIFIEVHPGTEVSEALFRWQPGPAFSAKKVVWCMRSAFGQQPTLHEKALDKKLTDLSPDSIRILWPNGQFIRDALEWVLSF